MPFSSGELVRISAPVIACCRTIVCSAVDGASFLCRIASGTLSMPASRRSAASRTAPIAPHARPRARAVITAESAPARAMAQTGCGLSNNSPGRVGGPLKSAQSVPHPCKPPQFGASRRAPSPSPRCAPPFPNELRAFRP
jgi:hypothetical protein